MDQGGPIMIRIYGILILLVSALSFANDSTNFMESVVGVYTDLPPHPGHAQGHSFGSGVIIKEDGYILTNYHVIANAYNITVQTNQGLRAQATVVGSAPESDLSILKIDPIPGQPLSPIKVGKSCDVKIGDPVTAVGNPFGFEQTLTQGVVSHVDRNVGLSQRVQSYIQVDAAVNPGNSGGALINKKGELVGIVSGIFGQGVNIGLAFAIPTDMANPVIQQLMSKGYATNGWVGLATQPLTPELKDALDVQNHNGVLISEIVPGSPAYRANLSPKDIILSINDIQISSPQHLASLVTALGSQSLVELQYLRDNKLLSTRVKTDQPSAYTPQAPFGQWGLNLAEFNRMGLDGTEKNGVEINQVAYQSSAALSGLQPGDIIRAVDNVPIKGLNDIKNNRLAKRSKTHLLEIERNLHTFFATIR